MGFKIARLATFKTKVTIPSTGSDAPVEYRTKSSDEMKDWVARAASLPAIDYLAEVIADIEVDDDTRPVREKLAHLLAECPDADSALYAGYIRALRNGERKN